MLTQRLVGDQGTGQGALTITADGQDPNALAELISLQEELKLRANIKTEGSLITQPSSPPPPIE